MGCCKSLDQNHQQNLNSSISNGSFSNDLHNNLLISSSESHLSDQNDCNTRGVSLQSNFSPLFSLLNLSSHEKKEEDRSYHPPVIEQPIRVTYFYGKSILKIPHLSSLQRKDWINKRGHVVRHH